MQNVASVKAEIVSLLRARNPLLWIQSIEERRVERVLIDAAGEAQYEVYFWDCVEGFTDATGKEINRSTADPGVALRTIRQDENRRIYVMRDIHRWLQSPVTLRQLRSLARALQQAPRNNARALVLLTPTTDVPPELNGSVAMVDFPLPDREEIAAILNTAIKGAAGILSKTPVNGSFAAAVDAAVGLTAEQASNCYARSIVSRKEIDPALVSNEKKRVIAAERVLAWSDPDPRGMDAVGGLDNLKEWLLQRKAALGPEAREYGLPSPRGVMLVGVPGCGKSLTAKAVAAAWGLPLLRLDIGAMRSKWVGESEGNIRKALKLAETVSPCVLWIDEIEKALAGSSGQSADGGVSADALGTILSWMQERAGSVFVVATANDVSVLPPELLRKGRFDELFFVDLPSESERKAILQTALTLHPTVCAKVKWSPKLAAATHNFTGSEIAALVPDAMFAAFNDGKRVVTEKDLLAAAKCVATLASTAAEKLTALRAWAKGRARSASVVVETESRERELDA